MKKYRLARGGKSKKENVRFRELLHIQIKIIENYFPKPLDKGTAQCYNCICCKK